MTQFTLEDAIAAGDAAAGHCLAKAESRDPDFSAKAEAAILDHLRVVRQCSGEVLTDVARAKGAQCHDGRAFGPIFKSLLKRRLIVVIGYAPRTKGHGCMGAKVYAIGN